MDQEDHEQRLKAALKSEFREVIDLTVTPWVDRFLYPQLEWLEQEIFEAPPDGQRRAVDLVAKIPTTQPVTVTPGDDPTDAFVGLVHVELEGRDPIYLMQERMQNYRHELKRKYRLPVLPLCIYRHVAMKGRGWDGFAERFFDETVTAFRYYYLALPGLDGLQYIAGSNLLGVALAGLMKIPENARPKAKADALEKILSSPATLQRKYLLSQLVEAYIPLEGVQMQEYEHLLVTPPYKEARQYGKTSFEQGEEKGLEKGLEKGRLEGQRKLVQELLTHRFGALSPAAVQRLDTFTAEQLKDLGQRSYQATKLSDLGLEDEGK